MRNEFQSLLDRFTVIDGILKRRPAPTGLLEKYEASGIWGKYSLRKKYPADLDMLVEQRALLQAIQTTQPLVDQHVQREEVFPRLGFILAPPGEEDSLLHALRKELVDAQKALRISMAHPRIQTNLNTSRLDSKTEKGWLGQAQKIDSYIDNKWKVAVESMKDLAQVLAEMSLEKDGLNEQYFRLKAISIMLNARLTDGEKETQLMQLIQPILPSDAIQRGERLMVQVPARSSFLFGLFKSYDYRTHLNIVKLQQTVDEIQTQETAFDLTPVRDFISQAVTRFSNTMGRLFNTFKNALNQVVEATFAKMPQPAPDRERGGVMAPAMQTVQRREDEDKAISGRDGRHEDDEPTIFNQKTLAAFSKNMFSAADRFGQAADEAAESFRKRLGFN